MRSRQIISNWKKDAINYTVDSLWKLGGNGYLTGGLIGGFNKEKRQLISANWLALKGEKLLASDILSEIISNNPSERRAVISLGSLLSQVGLENPASLWAKIRDNWLLIDKPEKINGENFHFFALGADLGLRCEPELAESVIKNVYFPFIWNFERLDKREIEPILYWHVPKTGGTSVNATLSRAWYKSGTKYLPSHTTRYFFSYVAKYQGGVFPYLSSAHLSALDIGVDNLRCYRKVLVLRDPEKRALSAWRQYRENPAARLNILPQHGAVWSFLPVCDLGEWAIRAPRHVVNPLEWTFSGFGDDIDSGIDYVLPLDNLACSGQKMVREMGLNLDDLSFRTEKNVTNKNIKPSLADIDVLKKACQPDSKFYELLQNKIYR